MSKEQIELSKKLLHETGGWKEMKRARSMHAAGRVGEARYEGQLLEGLVSDSGKQLKVRMEIRSRTDWENQCPCFRTRRDGIICAHALAVALEILEPQSIKSPPDASESSQTASGDSAPSLPVTLAPDWPNFSESGDQDLVPAQLHVVLSPHFLTAWEKGTITVGIEIETEGERCLLKAWQKNKGTLFLDAHDAALIRRLQQIMPETVPGMIMLPPEDLTRLFSAIAGHSRLTLGKSEKLTISNFPFRPPIRRTGQRSFLVDWPQPGQGLPSDRGSWFYQPETATLQVATPGLPQKFHSIFRNGYTIEESDWEKDLTELQSHFDFGEFDVIRETPEVHLHLEGSLNHLDARFSFSYSEDDTEQNLQRIRLADVDTEQSAFFALSRWGFLPKKGGSHDLILKNRDQILRFFAHGYPRLCELDWEITTGERFEHAGQKVEPISGELDFFPHPGSGENWFEMEVDFASSSGNRIPQQEIQRLLQMGQNHKKLANGKITVIDLDLLEEFGEAISDCQPTQQQPGRYQIDRIQAEYLRETTRDFGFSSKGELPWHREGEQEFAPTPDSLAEMLRPYQKEGVAWMRNRVKQGGGGILADDMGLGKTVQTLTLIQSMGGNALVICPSSLVANWVSEAQKFVPDLKAVAIEGPKRHEVLEKKAGAADILVTSYALMRRDKEYYQARDFAVIVIDEAQHIKNPEAEISKVIHRLQGRHRFALTGTPIENSVRDLWSIMHFTSPGYLGSRQEFAERFEKPLSSSKGGDSSALRERLARRLRPFLLRRLKHEVARDLPEKIEQVLYCDLTSTQQEVYEKILRQSRESLLDAEGGRRRMMALTALLRLRQACCDLRLLGLPDVENDQASVKADTLQELLSEAIEGGHRVLIFSQFVEMLQILVPLLAEQQISYCYLDGQTKNRGEVVNRFQSDESIPVFLISLKAGGVGLNLTGADTVIHVDPWWNPAVEAQATDRAHRIGQTKVVTSYKLITRNTVEEKILKLQNRKREMMEAILENNGEALNQGESAITEEEMMELLQ